MRPASASALQRRAIDPRPPFEEREQALRERVVETVEGVTSDEDRIPNGTKRRSMLPA